MRWCCSGINHQCSKLTFSWLVPAARCVPGPEAYQPPLSGGTHAQCRRSSSPAEDYPALGGETEHLSSFPSLLFFSPSLSLLKLHGQHNRLPCSKLHYNCTFTVPSLRGLKVRGYAVVARALMRTNSGPVNPPPLTTACRGQSTVLGFT